ncbi:MAG: hypothetical protein E7454_06700 [Ruminococcaceae bacterium]|nr:hypothetical protein [Oscillospiraceae bacterium]
METQMIDRIYELLTGECAPTANDPIVENMFAEGRTCDELYSNVYEANLRLCERLGVQEDADVELIIDAMMRISKLLGRKMFSYGAKYAAVEFDKK